MPRIRLLISERRSPAAFRAAAAEAAACCVVGSSAALGSWDPKRSPQLRRGTAAGCFEGLVDDGALQHGEEYKFCILNVSKNLYVWEEQGPMHRGPAPGAHELVSHFENASEDSAVSSSVTAAVPSRGYSGAQQPAVAATASPAGGQLRLQVRVSSRRSPKAAKAPSDAVLCAVGEPSALGAWDPKRAPQLKRTRTDGDFIVYEGVVDTSKLKPKQEYKYCIFSPKEHLYVWEEGCPLHCLPSAAKAVHDFEDGVQDHSSAAGDWPPPELLHAVTAPAAAARAAELPGPVTDQWIPWGGQKPSISEGDPPPRSIFHAFHWPFTVVKERLKDLHEMGFSAVQISPAQKSKSGGEWWTRYQPQDYLQLEGLGSQEDLRDLCRQAAELGVMIIGDVVFNHMIVVASGGEWAQAQNDAQQLKRLQQRLASSVGPELDVDDFQWPWFNMCGDHWDNENRYEGWGNGEWSELRYSPKVVAVQQKHLKLLLDAGVRGFRFDAVKHMRPEHIGDLLRFLRESGGANVYAYGEVLSVDEKMHKEYMDPLQMPTTDFGLTVYLNAVLAGSAATAKAGSSAAVAAAAASEGIRVSSDIERSNSESPAALASDSVRFARNHDTVMNPGSFYGLSGSCQSSKLAWTWLLAVHDGSVLVYPEDVLHEESGPLLRRALRFRSRMGTKASTSEVCVRFSASGGPPSLLAVALRSTEGQLVGLCLANLMGSQGLRLTSVPVKHGFPLGARLVGEDGQVVEIQANGDLQNSGGGAINLAIPASDALFLWKE